MKPNLYLYHKFKKLLKEEFTKDIVEYEDGNHINLEGSDLWISVDDRELTIGFGLHHIHYNFDYSSLEDAIDTFFLILRKEKNKLLKRQK